MYHTGTIQFSKNVQFVYCNYHQFIFAMSRWHLEVAGISKHVVWCHIYFGKCQNLSGSIEKPNWAVIQFSKNVQFVYYNYHKFRFATE